jgi:hypothetical protein
MSASLLKKPDAFSSTVFVDSSERAKLLLEQWHRLDAMMRDREGGGGISAIGSTPNDVDVVACAAAVDAGDDRPAIIISRDESNAALSVVDIIGALLVAPSGGNDDDGEDEPRLCKVKQDGIMLFVKLLVHLVYFCERHLLALQFQLQFVGRSFSMQVDGVLVIPHHLRKTKTSRT